MATTIPYVRLPSKLMGICLAQLDDIIRESGSAPRIKNMTDILGVWDKYGPVENTKALSTLTGTPYLQVLDEFRKAMELWLLLNVKTDYVVMERKYTATLELKDIIDDILDELNDAVVTTELIFKRQEVQKFMKNYKARYNPPSEELESIPHVALAATIEERFHRKTCGDCYHTKK